MNVNLNKIVAGILSLFLLGTAMTAAAEETDPTYGLFDTDADYWAFTNSSHNFGSSYYLTDADLNTLMDNLKNTEKAVVNRVLPMRFSGACYGMAVTSILASYNLIHYGDYRQYASGTPSSLYEMTSSLYPTPNEATISLINYYFMLQCTDAARQELAWFVYNYTPEERIQALIACVKDGSPVLTGFTGYINGRDYLSRHAIVAYGLEYGEFTVNGTTFDGRILVYDSNYPLSAADLTSIYFNTADWSWYIAAYNMSNETGWIDGAAEDVAVLNAGGMLEGTEYIPERPFMQVLGSNTFTCDFTLEAGTITETGWTNRGEPEDWKHAEYGFYTDNLENITENYCLPGEEQGYLLTLDAPEYLESVLYSENSMLRSYTDAGTSAAYDPSGYIALKGEPGAYHMEMTFNEGAYPTSWYCLTVDGYGAEECLRMRPDGYLLTGDSMTDVAVAVHNDSQSAAIVLSAEEETVWIYETAEGTLAAAVDTDGNGIYETIIAESETVTLGDVNGDGCIDAADAAEVLEASAAEGIGGESGFTESQKLAADANGDGIADAADAAWILQYAAAAGAGSEEGFAELLR